MLTPALKKSNVLMTIHYCRTVEMDTTMGVIRIINPEAPSDEPKSFTFDTVFDWKYDPTIFLSLSSLSHPTFESKFINKFFYSQRCHLRGNL